MKRIIFIALTVSLTLSLNLLAQSFMPSYMPSFGYKKGFVVKQNNDSIHGTFTKIYHTENITSLTIKDGQEVKHKLKEEEISRVYIAFSDIDKFSTSIGSGSSSMKDISQTSFSQVFKADYFIWEQAITPKKGKIKVLQLVNPGFDTKMKVYRNPTSGETGGVGVGGIKLTGGIEKSYFIVKKGEVVATEVEKGKYKKAILRGFYNYLPGFI